MNIKTALIAALAGVFAVTAAAPSFAAQDPAKKEKRINRLIKRADLSGDGKISQSEMSRGIAVTFAKLDTNGDGKLGSSEISNAMSGSSSAIDVTSMIFRQSCLTLRSGTRSPRGGR